ncbi:MAG: hypothetical protein EHM72_15140 [Calditrichaeota bacterium]|nr:MAG: hypothetical protein EHM72_15140 [Calditrichota bacterium]
MECCEKVLQQICDDLAENIHSPLCQKLRAHLDECDDCRQQVQSMRSAIKLYQCLKDKDVPADIHKRLITLLNVE